MRAALARAYRQVGLVPILVSVATVVAAAVHHASRLPGAYTWSFSLRLFRDTVTEPCFPTLAVAVFVIGAHRPREGLSLHARLREVPRERLLLSLLVGLLVAIGAGFTQREWLVTDAIACGLAVAHLIALPIAPATIVRGGIELGVVLVLYTAASYAHTVAKALVFVHPAKDATVLALERTLFFGNPHRVLTPWAAQHPAVLTASSYMYRWCTGQMLLVSVLLVGARRGKERVEYLAALCFALVIAAPLYHVLPSRGPYYHESGLYRHLADARLVSAWYHGLEANTRDAILGRATEVTTYQYLAAMPSLHVGFTGITLYYARCSRIAFVVSIAATFFAWFATMVLGWHYFADGVAGLVIGGLAIAVAHASREHLLPRFVAGATDAPSSVASTSSSASASAVP